MVIDGNCTKHWMEGTEIEDFSLCSLYLGGLTNIYQKGIKKAKKSRNSDILEYYNLSYNIYSIDFACPLKCLIKHKTNLTLITSVETRREENSEELSELTISSSYMAFSPTGPYSYHCC